MNILSSFQRSRPQTILRLSPAWVLGGVVVAGWIAMAALQASPLPLSVTEARASDGDLATTGPLLEAFMFDPMVAMEAGLAGVETTLGNSGLPITFGTTEVGLATGNATLTLAGLTRNEAAAEPLLPQRTHTSRVRSIREHEGIAAEMDSRWSQYEAGVFTTDHLAKSLYIDPAAGVNGAIFDPSQLSDVSAIPEPNSVFFGLALIGFTVVARLRARSAQA